MLWNSTGSIISNHVRLRCTSELGLPLCVPAMTLIAHPWATRPKGIYCEGEAITFFRNALPRSP